MAEDKLSKIKASIILLTSINCYNTNINVVKKILLVIGSAIIVFVLSTSIYLIISKHSFQLLSPLATSHFSLYNQPEDSLIGNIATLSGKILWQSRIADKGKPITALRKLQQGEEISTGDDGKTTIEFPGVGSINLDKNTDISIIQTLPANLILQEKEGKATFSKEGSNIPLSIRAFDLLINLQSGIIDVSVDKDKSQVMVFVTSGSAKVAYTDTNNVTQVSNVSKGNTIIFNNNTRRLY